MQSLDARVLEPIEERNVRQERTDALHGTAYDRTFPARSRGGDQAAIQRLPGQRD